MLSFLTLLACSGGGTPATTTATPSPVSSAIAAPDVAADPATVIATWEGGQLTYAELEAELSGQLKQLQIEYLQNVHALQSQALESMAITAIIEAEAASRGMDQEALLEAEVGSKVAPPTDQEVEDFYPVVKRQFRNAPLEQVRPQVAAYLMQRKQGERIEVLVGELREKYALSVDLPYPDIPRLEVSVDDDPTLGPKDAPVTIIEFGEYQCGYCGRAHETIQKVLETYGDKVSLTFRDFPLQNHDRAIPAAIAAQCAGDQGKYWEMHHELLTNQRALEDTDLKNHASKVGLDMAAWSACIADGDSRQAEIQKDFEDGQAVGVSGTPAFFVNGIMLSGAQPFEEFKKVIDRELGS